MVRRRSSHGEGCLLRKKKNGRPYGSYFIRYYEGKTRYAVSLHTADLAEAKHKWHQWVISRDNGSGSKGVNSNIEVVTWLQDFVRYRKEAAEVKKSIKPATYNKDEDTVNNLTRFLKAKYPGLRMKDLATPVFDDYMVWRSKETRFHNKSKAPITKRGINKELSLLATIFKRAVKLKIISANPVTDVERFGVDEDPNRDIVPWPVEQVRQIIQEVRPDARDAIAFVAMTGCRRGEMEHLRWRDVDFDRNIVVINGDQKTEWTPKTRSGCRDIPMSKAMRSMLLRVRKAATQAKADDVVFTTPDGRAMYEWSDFPLRRFQNAIRRLQKQGVDIAWGSLRTLRHWFISHAINRDDDPLTLLEVQRIVGHGDLSMIERVYYHPDRSKVQRKMSSFGEDLLPDS